MSAKLLRARPARVVPAVIVAILILALAVGLGWVGIAAILASNGAMDSALTNGLPGLDGFGSQQWGSPVIITIGIALALVGLILVIAAVSPGHKRLTGYRAETPDHIDRFEVALPTSALSNLAAAAADSVDGVSSVRAASNATSTNITFTTPVRDNAQIRNDVDSAVTERFASIAFDRTPTVKVHAQRRPA